MRAAPQVRDSETDDLVTLPGFFLTIADLDDGAIRSQEVVYSRGVAGAYLSANTSVRRGAGGRGYEFFASCDAADGCGEAPDPTAPAEGLPPAALDHMATLYFAGTPTVELQMSAGGTRDGASHGRSVFLLSGPTPLVPPCPPPPPAPPTSPPAPPPLPPGHAPYACECILDGRCACVEEGQSMASRRELFGLHYESALTDVSAG